MPRKRPEHTPQPPQEPEKQPEAPPETERATAAPTDAPVEGPESVDLPNEVQVRLRRFGAALKANPPKFGESDRFDKFTQRAKQSMVLAQSEADRLNHNYIGTEHLLLGLVAEGEGIASKVLTNLNIGLAQVRSSVVFMIGRGDRKVIGERSLTPRSKKVVDLAIDEARLLNHTYVGTEHLMLGLIREGEGIAAGVLESLGVDMARARSQVLDIIAKHVGGAGISNPTIHLPRGAGSLAVFAPAKDSVITCRIASEDQEALDALIEAGIRSTRSDAAAWLIHAGIQANLDLFDKVYTTVAEIKRLRDQAQTAAKDLESRDHQDKPNPASPPSS